MSPPWSLLELVREAAGYLARKGVASPRLDAEILLAHVLGCRRIDLYLRFDQPVSEPELDRFRELVSRRGHREPVAYITGLKEFWSFEFKVTPQVLIPRPETETLVEAALEELRGAMGSCAGPLWAMEIGTGSGAVALSVAKEMGPSVLWVATDISREALSLASHNARQLGVDQWVWFLQGDLLSSLLPKSEKFHLILSNPPYVRTDCIRHLEPEISSYEPLEALDGGVDGLRIVTRLLEEAGEHLVAGGALMLEVGEDQTVAVENILESQLGWSEWGWRRDLAGKPRVIWARKGER